MSVLLSLTFSHQLLMSFSLSTSLNWNAPPKFLQRTESIVLHWADLRENTSNIMLPRNFLIHRYSKFASHTKHHSPITYSVDLFIWRGIPKNAYFIIKFQEEAFILKSSHPPTDPQNHMRNGLLIFIVQDKFNFPDCSGNWGPRFYLTKTKVTAFYFRFLWPCIVSKL